MITTKELRKSINNLQQLGDLMQQKDRQIEFWRDAARKQIRRNNKLQAELEDLR